MPEGLFLRVQEVLRRRYQEPGEKGRVPFPLRGVVVCGECGYRMTAERHGRWSDYRCTENTARRGCPTPFSNAERSHDSLRALYRRLQLADELEGRIREAGRQEVGRRLATARREAKPAQQRIERLLEQETRVAEAFSAGDMPTNVCETVARKIRAGISAAQAALRDGQLSADELLGTPDSVLNLATTLADLHDTLDLPRQQDLLHIAFEDIALDRGQVVGHTPQPPFDKLPPISTTDWPAAASPLSDGARSNLGDTHPTPATQYNLEFDDTRVRRLLKSRTHERAA